MYPVGAKYGWAIRMEVVEPENTPTLTSSLGTGRRP